MLYRKAGEAVFYCPFIARQTEGLHRSLLTPEEDAGIDPDGHAEWIFSWAAGAYHITHEANGHPQVCAKCGQALELVKGDDPYGPDA